MTDLFAQLRVALADRYSLQRELGAGGMATVYLAEDLKLHRKVALKVLRPELSAVLGPERFEREIEIAAKLTHPHILTVFDAGEAGGFLYYVMPFAEGESLRELLLREKQLPLDDAIQIAREVADALSYAHGNDVIHRDIKPENILLVSGHAVVADFGIARAITAAGGDKLTQTGMAIGTPEYMSPEQATGSDDLDGRSDLYSLGCMVYEMLGGQPPFTGATAQSIVLQQVTAEPRPVTTVRPGVPAEVAAAIQRALSKSPSDRFNPAAKFGDALRTQPGGTRPIKVHAAPAWRRWAIGAAVVAALVATGMLGRQFFAAPVSSAAEIEARWIIVAEFDGSADSMIRATARDLLTTALNQSPATTILPASDISRGLARAGKPDTARITEELAIELAIRAQIPAVVAGEVNRVGSTYALSFRVISSDSGTVMTAVQEIARSDDEVIDKVDAAARALVKGIEDDPAALGPIRPLSDVMTPSMAALQKYRAAQNAPSQEEKLSLLREALALDTGFAEAYAYMTIPFGNTNRPDSVRAVAEKALGRPDRLSEYRRLRTEGMLKFAEYDYGAGYQHLRRAWEGGGRSEVGAGNVAVMLTYMGEWERALEVIQLTRSTFGRDANLRSIELNSALASGEFEIAQEVLDEDSESLSGVSRAMGFRGARAQWRQAENLAVELTKDPTTPPVLRAGAMAVQASALAARGQVKAAATLLVATQDTVPELGYSDDPDGTARRVFTQRLQLLSLVSGSPNNHFESDTSTVNGRLEAALDAALAGEADLARTHLGILRGLPRDSIAHLASAPDVVGAVIAASEAAGDSVIRILTPMEAWTWPHRLRYGPPYGGLILYLLAQAYEATDQPDSAAIYYQKLGSPVQLRRRYASADAGLVYPFAHQRLVLLYSRMDRIEDAERHWRIFSETFTNPDPELEYLVLEAREAFEAAVARAR